MTNICPIYIWYLHMANYFSDGAAPPPPSLRIHMQGASSAIVEWIPTVPVVSMTTITLSIPALNYTINITSAPEMTLSYSFPVIPGTDINAFIFATNEYGSGNTAYAYLRVEGITGWRNDGGGGGGRT